MGISFVLVASLIAANRADAGEVKVAETCGSVRPYITAAQPGDTVILPAAECVITAAIAVPDGITIEGQPGSVLTGDFSHLTSSAPVFNLNGTDGATFSDFQMRLRKNAMGFRGTGGSGVTIRRLAITGNQTGDDTSSIAIYLTNYAGTVVEQNSIRHNFGGIYVTGTSTGTRVRSNVLTSVNFGNINVGGSDIEIFDNHVNESGKVSPRHHPSGDGVTIGRDASDVRIIGNTFSVGYCYLIQAPFPTTGVTVEGNTFDRGVTSAVYLVNSTGAVIRENQFQSNGAHGVALPNGVDATVVDNTFVADTIYAKGMTGEIRRNSFVAAGPAPIMGTHNASAGDNVVVP